MSLLHAWVHLQPSPPPRPAAVLVHLSHSSTTTANNVLQTSRGCCESEVCDDRAATAALSARPQAGRSYASLSLGSPHPLSRKCDASAAFCFSTVTSGTSSQLFASPTGSADNPTPLSHHSSPVPRDYVGLLHYLHALNRNRGVRLGLSTMRTLLSALPPTLYQPNTYPTIHIAGSNGKGSTAHKLAAALSAHRLRPACTRPRT